MFDILKIDHVGIRVRRRDPAVAFYQWLGFAIVSEGVFEQGHPVIMAHPSGVVINVLGPADADDGGNVLMDGDARPAGITHLALRVRSLADVAQKLEARGVPITGRIQFKDLNALFVRDPDRNVIEFDEYPGEQPETRVELD